MGKTFKLDRLSVNSVCVFIFLNSLSFSRSSCVCYVFLCFFYFCCFCCGDDTKRKEVWCTCWRGEVKNFLSLSSLLSRIFSSLTFFFLFHLARFFLLLLFLFFFCSSLFLSSLLLLRSISMHTINIYQTLCTCT